MHCTCGNSRCRHYNRLLLVLPLPSSVVIMIVVAVDAMQSFSCVLVCVLFLADKMYLCSSIVQQYVHMPADSVWNVIHIFEKSRLHIIILWTFLLTGRIILLNTLLKNHLLRIKEKISKYFVNVIINYKMDFILFDSMDFS